MNTLAESPEPKVRAGVRQRILRTISSGSLVFVPLTLLLTLFSVGWLGEISVAAVRARSWFAIPLWALTVGIPAGLTPIVVSTWRQNHDRSVVERIARANAWCLIITFLCSAVLVIGMLFLWLISAARASAL